MPRHFLILTACLAVWTNFSTHGGPLDGYQLLSSCHEPSVVLGESARIKKPEDLYANIGWLAEQDIIFVLNAFTLAPQWNSTIDHMVGVSWEGKPEVISTAAREAQRFEKRTVWAENMRLLHEHRTDAVKLLGERAAEKDVTFFVLLDRSQRQSDEPNGA